MAGLRIIIAAIAVVSAGCANDPSSAPTPGESHQSAPRDDDMFEAVFRYQFNHHPYNVKETPPSYYLKVLGGDPSPEFLARFADLATRVKKSSQYDTGAGIPGHYSIEKAELTDPGDVRVTTYYSDGAFASGNTTLLAKNEGAWTVIRLEDYFVE